MQTLQLDEKFGEDVRTISVWGDVDATDAAQLRDALRRVPAGAAVVVDLRRVPFMDSASLGALICGIRELRARGGTAALCARAGGVRRLLAVTGFDRIVVTAASPDEAADAIGAHGDASVDSYAI